MRRDPDVALDGGVRVGMGDPNETGEGMTVAGADTDTRLVPPADVLATGAFEGVKVTREELVRRFRVAWKGQPHMNRVIDRLEGSFAAEGGTDTLSASEVAQRFAAMVRADEDIRGITHGTRAFVDDKIGGLLADEWDDQHLMTGEGMEGEQIGRGSFGTVHRVAMSGLPAGMEAVAKRFDPLERVAKNEADVGKVRDRFVREVAVVRELDGYPTAKYIGSGELEGKHPFVLMEFLKGADLGRYVEEVRRTRELLPRPFVYNVAALLFKALHHIHHHHELRHRGHNIIHRDLKPDNVRICADGRVLLMDFGLRKAEGTEVEGLTSHGTAVGTMMYMAPEQMKGETATARSDVYAAGLMVHEMLTGRVPHAAETQLQVYQNRMVGETDMSAYGADEPLAQHIGEILEADPGLRPRGAAEAGELFFQRSEFAGRYATYAEFLADTTTTLPSMPPVYPANAAPEGGEYEQQGGSLVATVGSTMQFWKTKYGTKEMEALKAPAKVPPRRRGLLHSTRFKVAAAAAVVLGVGAAAFSFVGNSGKEQDRVADTKPADKLPPPPPVPGVGGESGGTPKGPEKMKKLKPFAFTVAEDGKKGIVFFPDAGAEVTEPGAPARAEFLPAHGMHFWRKGEDGQKGTHAGSIHYMLPGDYMNVRGNTSLAEMRGQANYLMAGGELICHECVIDGQPWTRVFPSNLGIYILQTPTKTIAFSQPLAKTSPLVQNCDEWAPLADMIKHPQYQQFAMGVDLHRPEDIVLDRGVMENFLGSGAANRDERAWKNTFCAPMAMDKADIAKLQGSMTALPPKR